MKIIELLKLNRELLKTCCKVGMHLDDVKYIDLYADYRALLARGNKVTYAVAVLAQRYGISERKVYSLIKRFKADCNLYAV